LATRAWAFATLRIEHGELMMLLSDKAEPIDHEEAIHASKVV